jgi:hypothetical protein
MIKAHVDKYFFQNTARGDIYKERPGKEQKRTSSPCSVLTPLADEEICYDALENAQLYDQEVMLFVGSIVDNGDGIVGDSDSAADAEAADKHYLEEDEAFEKHYEQEKQQRKNMQQVHRKRLETMHRESSLRRQASIVKQTAAHVSRQAHDRIAKKEQARPPAGQLEMTPCQLLEKFYNEESITGICLEDLCCLENSLFTFVQKSQKNCKNGLQKFTRKW